MANLWRSSSVRRFRVRSIQCGGSCAHAWLIERYFGSGFRFFHGSTAPVLTTRQHWFAGDALGIVTVAPLLIGLVSAARERPSQKRGHRRRYGVRGAGRSERPCCSSTAGVNRRPNLTPDRLPLYVSIEFATAARSCACGLRPRGRDPAWSDGLENHVSLEPRLIAFRDHQTSGLTEGVNIAGD
jgi:hypothetical protein